MKDFIEIKEILQKKGLKATTQRLVIYAFISETFTHPTAEEIFSEIKNDYPSISLSTVYNTLDTLIENNLIKTVKNDGHLVRYDAIVEPHHHLYCDTSNKIEDYHNRDLDLLLTEFFKQNQIPDFAIKEINIQIKGNFNTKEGNKNE